MVNMVDCFVDTATKSQIFPTKSIMIVSFQTFSQIIIDAQSFQVKLHTAVSCSIK